MERIRIPNRATYTPFPLLDMAMVAPLASRLLLRATLPGKAVQVAVMGAYAASAAKDWSRRRHVRKIDFLSEFGADIDHLQEMTEESRQREITALVERANDAFTPQQLSRPELALLVDDHLTDYIASITGQWVETSTEIRNFTIAQLVFPFALGACDFLSGEVAIFRDTGILEPHVIAHEFTHRKGYWKELEAQAISYLALASSGEPILVQAARCERIHRHLRVLSGDDTERFASLLAETGLRDELASPLLGMRRPPGPVQQKVEAVMRWIYDERMRLTGQNGLEDYDLGFTNFLYTFERSPSARQIPPDPVL